MSRSFRPDEISGSRQPALDDLDAVMAAARDLEWLAADGSVSPSEGFVDRVNAAVAAEPPPSPAVAMRIAFRRGSLAAVLRAIGGAWRIATSGSRPLAARAQAIALVLAVTLAAGSLATAAAVGGLGVFRAGPLAPAASPAPMSPVATRSPSPLPSRSPSEEPSESTTETPDATETPEASPSTNEGGVATERPAESARPAPGVTPEPADRASPEPDRSAQPGSSEAPGSQGSAAGN